MSLGTKNRQIQTVNVCKEHLRHKQVDQLALVEEFIRELGGSGKERVITKCGQFTDASHIPEKMLKRLDERFDKWLNPRWIFRLCPSYPT